MTQPFKTVITAKPAVENAETDDFHFKIPRHMIRSGVVDPDKMYNLWLEVFDVEK